MARWVYNFGDGEADGRAELKNLLGGKGANLAEMASIGLPVPPNFTLTTEVCAHFYQNGCNYPKELNKQVEEALALVQQRTGRVFGDSTNPLLVSVRSGARASMPGMMDTVLNLGLNDQTVEALAKKSGDRRFAFDSYRRFVQMYSDVVLGIEISHFEKHLERAKEKRGVKQDCELPAEDLEKLVKSYKAVVQLELGEDFPEDPKAQLWGAIGAVFNSWMNQRAKTYRQLHDIPEWWGTAVNVQAMVFGNMGSDCATGVAFTRDPSTGTNEFYGEFLVNAQGEDVVAGIRTPQELTIKARKSHGSDLPSLEKVMPQIFKELLSVRSQLETHYKDDMHDIEFTIQQGKLYMLQTRNGKRTAPAALKIAVEMAQEGLISKQQAILSLKPDLVDQLLHPTLDPKAKKDVIAKGLPASPGAAGGKVALLEYTLVSTFTMDHQELFSRPCFAFRMFITWLVQVVFSADEAVRRCKDGEKVILVRIETSPDDIHGLHAAEGDLTTRGGMTSHAAVVARGMGRPCVAGAGAITVDYTAAKLTVGAVTVAEGQILTIDGSTGEVIVGEVPTVPPQLSGSFGTIMEWADEFRDMKVRANAETPADARQAKEFGAEGIGLVRTEHMFFEGQRIVAMRQMILATDESDRRQALEKLLVMQREDITELFQIMDGMPVTVRLLDPPLHEFIPLLGL
ncbi:ppdK [Symbiodinium sp. CCMP2592]|nr:ppdK [Symbiodinium sp. CCMP2592]